MKYSTHQTEVEAVQFTGSNAHEIWTFIGREADLVSGLPDTCRPTVRTHRGDESLQPGDWVIRYDREGAPAEFGVYNNDMFAIIFQPGSLQSPTEKIGYHGPVSLELSEANEIGYLFRCWILELSKEHLRRHYMIEPTHIHLTKLAEFFLDIHLQHEIKGKAQPIRSQGSLLGKKLVFDAAAVAVTAE